MDLTICRSFQDPFLKKLCNLHMPARKPVEIAGLVVAFRSAKCGT
jgi:hypothetical protein